MIKSLVKKDLYSHFVSPHFYICSLILHLSCTFQYFIFGRFFIEGFGSSSLNNFFSVIPYVFSLIIPVLVMEVSNKEIENTFPFSDYEINFSKIISTVLILFVMIVPLFSVPVIVNIFGQVDFGQVVVAFIGIILYGFLASSLCVLLKELIRSKPVFVCVSILVLLGMDCIHLISQSISSQNFISNFCNSISFIWHFDSFSKGIIDTRDVFYFILTSFLFIVISFAVTEIKKGKKIFRGKNKIYSLLFILVIVFSYIDNFRLYKRFDCTQSKQFSVSKYTKEILKYAEEPVRISYYRSKELLARYPEIKDIYDYLKIISKENRNISLKIFDTDSIENTDNLEKLGVIPQQIEIINNNRAEYIKVYSAIIIEYLGKQKVIPFVLSTASLEFELNIRFDSLIRNRNNCVYLMCGNEYEVNDYSYLQLLLESSDITCYAITKESLLYIQDQLSTDVPFIIFGSHNLLPEQCAAIEKFILKGGKTLIATSKYSVDINGNWGINKNTEDNLIPVLESWGIKFADKIVNDISNIRVSFYSSGSNQNYPDENTVYEYVNYPQWISVLPQNNVPDGITMFWSSPIMLSDNMEPLFYSSSQSWTVKEFDEVNQKKTNQLFISDPFTISKTFINDSHFTKEQSILCARIKGPVTGLYNFETINNPQVIILSDQYFAMNLLLELSGGGTSDFRNLDYIIRTVFTLEGKEELISLQNAGFKNTQLYKITDQYKFISIARKVLVVEFIIIPLFYIILALIIFILRKNKNIKYRKNK